MKISEYLDDLAMVAGVGLIGRGLAMFHPAFGYITAGLGLFAAVWIWNRGR